MGTENQPVSAVQWVHRDELHPNEYNPNHVAPPELELLKTSLKEDGWTVPIVALPDGEIVDGYHRWTVSGDPEVWAMTDGYVPVAYLAADPVHQRMSTIRHNRARGAHGVLPMAEIVRGMNEDGVTVEQFGARLGMEDEEVLRLLDRAGMPLKVGRGSKGGATEFGQAWKPSKEGDADE